MHQFRFAQFANKALSNTYFAILALLELCKIICFPSLCSGTKYISKARSARFANKVSFRFNFYGPANFVYMLPFTTRWIKKYILKNHCDFTVSCEIIKQIRKAKIRGLEIPQHNFLTSKSYLERHHMVFVGGLETNHNTLFLALLLARSRRNFLFI